MTLGYGLLGSFLSWLALPPVGLAPLAWLAPMPWLLLVRRAELPGRRPYLALWAAGTGFWLLAVHWLRLPHPATSLGWIALSIYLGIYLSVFVGLSRVAVHELRISMVLAAPAVWTGLELAQAHLLTGVNIATPGHSQYRFLELIQISDLCGGYGVSFVMMFVAACVVRMLPLEARRWSFWPLAPAAATLIAVLAYGHLRMAGDHLRPGLKVGLIQGSIDTEMKTDPAQVRRIHDQYLALTHRAVREHADLDLVVWPETMFREPLLTLTEDVRPAPGEDWTKADLLQAVEDVHLVLSTLAARFKVPLLLGMDTLVFGPGKMDRFNSAVLIDTDGQIGGRYDKMRPVMFGEYVPFGDYLPWLYRLTPLAGGIQAGAAPQSLSVGGARIAPNICFETLLPHFIRGQVAELRRQAWSPTYL